MSRVDEDSFRKFRKESRVKTSDTDNTKLDLFLMDSEYVDSEKTEKMLYLFNEEEGYGIYIHNTSDLTQEEIEKVAEGLKVSVLQSRIAKFRIRCRLISFQEKTMHSMKMRLLCG